MASVSLTNDSQLIDARILEDVAAEVVIGRFPGIEDRCKGKVFSAYTAATAALIQPSLNELAQAYRHACGSPFGREAARVFMTNLLEAEA